MAATAAQRVSVPGIDHQVAVAVLGVHELDRAWCYEDGNCVTAPLFVNPFYATGFPITEAYWADGPGGRHAIAMC